jgi:hypothetical protein
MQIFLYINIITTAKCQPRKQKQTVDMAEFLNRV